MTYINLPYTNGVGTSNNSLPAFDVLSFTNMPIQSSKLGENFKAKKAGNNGSHVFLIVDESGSMGHLRDTTISSVNEFIESQKIDAIQNDIPTIVSVYTFDGANVKCIINKADVKSEPKINRDNYNPIGGTNLNDAFGSVIATINEDFASKKKKERSSVIIAVMTDGAENTSRTFTKNDINQMVIKCQDAKWAFVFMGANIDAFAAGNAYGFNMNNTMQYDASSDGVAGSMQGATRMVSSMKAALATGEGDVMAMYSQTAFTDAERAKSMGEKDE